MLIAGLADLGFGVEFEWVFSETFLSGAGCGDDAGPPGKGLRAVSPGRGFLAGLAVMESDLEFREGAGPSLGAPEGRDTRPFPFGFFSFLSKGARRFGATLKVMILLFFFLGIPESNGLSTFARLGAGVGCSSFSGRGRLLLEADEGSGGQDGLDPDEEVALACRDRPGDATMVSLSCFGRVGFGL